MQQMVEVKAWRRYLTALVYRLKYTNQYLPVGKHVADCMALGMSLCIDNAVSHDCGHTPR